MVDPIDPAIPALLWHVRREPDRVRYFVDVPGVLDPDLDVAIEGAFVVVRAQRSLPATGVLSCRLPVPEPFDLERIDLRLEWGVLEVVLPARRAT